MKKLLIILGLILVAGMWGADPVLAIGIDFSNMRIVGNQFSTDVVVMDLGKEVVSTYDLAVGYNSNVISAEAVNFSGKLGDPNKVVKDPITGLEMKVMEVLQFKDISTAGSIIFKETSLLPDEKLFELQGGENVLLATLLFTINSEPASTFSVAESVVPDFGLEFVWGPANEVVGRNDTTLIPAPVPEPATIFLFGVGLAGLAGFGRRRIKKS